MDFEIQANGRTVWVNGADGCCIGRFSRFGVDVHRTFREQAAGMGKCLTCTHGIADEADWQIFVRAMLKHHKVPIPDSVRPHWL